MSEQEKISRFARITVNGQSYASVDEMPPEVRQQFEQTLGNVLADKDGNGIPDVFEGSAEQLVPSNAKITAQCVILNGKRYDRLEALPPEIREAISRGLPDGLKPGGAIRVPIGEPTYISGPPPQGGVNIHLTWPSLIGLTALVTGVIVWLIRNT